MILVGKKNVKLSHFLENLPTFLLNIGSVRIKIRGIRILMEVTRMEKSEIKDKLLEIIGEELPDVETDKVDTSASLADDYGVDSVSLIKMIVDAEAAFNVKFDDRELALNKYDNFDDVIDTIEKKLQ